jgi:hypothetical protein
MSDELKVGSARMSRRRTLLQGVAALVAAPIVLGTITNKAAAGKFAQKAVLYQPTPKGDRKCSACVHFQPPNACQSVGGVISPDGWCAIWKAAS